VFRDELGPRGQPLELFTAANAREFVLVAAEQEKPAKFPAVRLEENRLEALDFTGLLKPRIILECFVEDLDGLSLTASDRKTEADEEPGICHDPTPQKARALSLAPAFTAWIVASPDGRTPATYHGGVADAEDVRRLALGLPHVEEIDSDGFDFRVGGRGFVWSYPERLPGKPRRIRTDVAVLYVGDEAEKQALLLGEPGTFFTTSEYDGWPLVLLRLAQVGPGRLGELVSDAWRMRAPKSLVGDLDELPGPD